MRSKQPTAHISREFSALCSYEYLISVIHSPPPFFSTRCHSFLRTLTNPSADSDYNCNCCSTYVNSCLHICLLLYLPWYKWYIDLNGTFKLIQYSNVAGTWMLNASTIYLLHIIQINMAHAKSDEQLSAQAPCHAIPHMTWFGVPRDELPELNKLCVYIHM